jgi:hypothetical protein
MEGCKLLWAVQHIRRGNLDGPSSSSSTELKAFEIVDKR